jgi:hypothetical protein
MGNPTNKLMEASMALLQGDASNLALPRTTIR